MGAGVLEVVVSVREAVDGEGGGPGTRRVGGTLEGLSAKRHIGAVSWHKRCVWERITPYDVVSATCTYFIVTTTLCCLKAPLYCRSQPN